MTNFDTDGGAISLIGNSNPKIGYFDGQPFVSANRPIYTPTNELIKGYTYSYMANRGKIRSSRAIGSRNKMYEIENNWVCLAVVNYQKTYHSTEIYADYVRTPSDRDITDFVNDAHHHSIKVCSKPMNNTEDGALKKFYK